MQQLRALAPPPPAPLTEEQPAWGSEAWAPSSSTDATRRIFCNRSLNMAHIKVQALLSEGADLGSGTGH